ncbi:ATP synthase gamma chain [candidate division SR1 bacterium]|nr:ATP synthase gamma chain [candidate division SR1 bacterium]
MSLKQIKNQLKSTRTLQKILGAMELASSIKLQSLTAQTRSFKRFFKDFIQVVVSLQPHLHIQDKNHFVIDQKKKLILVISTEKGLVGSLNSKLFDIIESRYKEGKDRVDLMTIGYKGEVFFRKNQRNIVASFPLKDKINAEYLVNLYKFLEVALKDQTYSKIKIYFNHSKNAFSQSPARLTLSPLSQETLKLFLHEINIPYPDIQVNDELIIEPNIEAYRKNTIQYVIENLVYYCILDSKISENSARFALMKLANQNNQEKEKKLTTDYNKARQDKITQDLMIASLI